MGFLAFQITPPGDSDLVPAKILLAERGFVGDALVVDSDSCFRPPPRVYNQQSAYSTEEGQHRVHFPALFEIIRRPNQQREKQEGRYDEPGVCVSKRVSRGGGKHR